MKKLLTSQCRADSTRCHCWKCSWSLAAALRRRNGWNSGAVAGEEETLTVGVGASVDLVGLVAWVETQVVVELLVEVLVGYPTISLL
ncbi:hypothetical protein D5086_028682 [Populus alba]|uniref:Uncharacterized protein n=2 Tax=Populus TaxID=3689 RepID=A0ACC4ASA5_POPAL